MTDKRLVFNPPPGWPRPPEDWTPPKGWTPDPAWPEPPQGWKLWLPADSCAEESIHRDRELEPGYLPSLAGAEAAPVPDAAGRRVSLLEAENAALRAQLDAAVVESDIVALDDEWVLQEVGIYRYRHPLENAVAYRERLDHLSKRIAELVKAKGAIETSSMFTFDNSLAKGRKMSNDLAKLMLRAYNAEVDNSLRSLRAGNVVTAKKRVEAARTAIMKLGKVMQMRISDEFHALRIEEIELTADYLMKKQEEREAAREERARLREERKVQAELAEERKRLEKERGHLLNALEALRSSGSLGSDKPDHRRAARRAGRLRPTRPDSVSWRDGLSIDSEGSPGAA